MDMGELGLSQLVKILNLSRKKHKPLLHYHLRMLERAELVEVSRVERTGMIVSAKYYKLSPKARILLGELATEECGREQRYLPTNYPITDAYSKDNTKKGLFSRISQILVGR